MDPVFDSYVSLSAQPLGHSWHDQMTSAISTACRGRRAQAIHGSEGKFPSFIPAVAIYTLAGKTATSKATSPQPASFWMLGMRIPRPPRISKIPLT